MTPITLTGALVEAFAGSFLSPRYDMPMPTPLFHREAWTLYTSRHPSCGVVAPRDHAKSTALTFDYILAEVCFRLSDYVILIGSTEDKAGEQLSNISEELHENLDLRAEFGIVGFESDQKTEIIVVCDDGHRFRILARGAEQKIRGALWKGKRPNLIVCDDMEDDEQVESIERRKKFRRWFFRACKQALSKSGKIRIHGTILHEDSLLSRLLKNKMWSFLFYKAHLSYDDFSSLLWPERWTEEQLRDKQKEFEEDGDPGGYAQEFLNDPQDMADAYLKVEQFRPMEEEDYLTPKLYYAGCDFAVSKSDLANRTCFVVGGRSVNSFTHITDVRVDRWDSLEWIEELFSIQKRWDLQVIFVEGGVIWNAVRPMIFNEMVGDTRSPKLRKTFGRKDIFINFEVLNPIKDKATRGRSFQKRMKAGMLKYDHKGSWFQGYKEENLKFTGGKQARLDDQFDATATLCIGLENLTAMEESDLDVPDPIEEEEAAYYRQSGEMRNRQTGY